MHDPPVDRPVFLERVGRELHARLLARMDEAGVLVAYEHLGHKLLSRRDERDEQRALVDPLAHEVNQLLPEPPGVRADALGDLV